MSAGLSPTALTGDRGPYAALYCLHARGALRPTRRSRGAPMSTVCVHDCNILCCTKDGQCQYRLIAVKKIYQICTARPAFLAGIPIYMIYRTIRDSIPRFPVRQLGHDRAGMRLAGPLPSSRGQRHVQ